MFYRTVMVFSELVASTVFYSYLFWCLYICEFFFPLLQDKQRFKFRGVMSISNTHFIPNFV